MPDIGDLVAPGTYKLTVSVSDFLTKAMENLTLAVGQTTTNNVSLEVGQQTQIVTVEATATLLNAEKTDVSTAITPHEVEDLPLEDVAAVLRCSTRTVKRRLRTARGKLMAKQPEGRA